MKRLCIVLPYLHIRSFFYIIMETSNLMMFPKNHYKFYITIVNDLIVSAYHFPQIKRPRYHSEEISNTRHTNKIGIIFIPLQLIRPGLHNSGHPPSALFESITITIAIIAILATTTMWSPFTWKIVWMLRHPVHE